MLEGELRERLRIHILKLFPVLSARRVERGAGYGENQLQFG
jgi:hypothetical protein